MNSPPRVTFRAAAWAVTVVVFFAAAVAAAFLWRTRASTDPLESMVAKLSALDDDMRHKLCAHRSNNVPKYRAANELFHCIEIDVVLNPTVGGPAAVYHPPVENHHGLTLEFLLANEGLPRGHLWLDVKDLSDDNWSAFLAMLLTLIPPERRSDIIIETGWETAGVREAAAGFRREGFIFSYYLPTEAAIECGAVRSQECMQLRAEVLQAVGMGFSHLSFDARAYPFVQSIRADLPPFMRLLTWHVSRDWPLLDLMNQVEVYIVRFPSPYST